MGGSGTLNYAIIRLLANQIAAFWGQRSRDDPIVLHSRTLIIHEQLAGGLLFFMSNSHSVQ